MKKSTLILVAVALSLGAFVYFYEMKSSGAREASSDTSKPAFVFPASDITSLTLERSDQKVSLEKQGGQWVITQPVETRADQSVVEGITDELASARISRTFPATADRLNAFGLAKPAVTVDFKLKDGAQHAVRLGTKDFSGSSVYGFVDQAKDVTLLPGTLLTSTDKPLDDLRDRSLLGLSTWDIARFDLNNAKGEIAATKQESNWRIEKPRQVAADTDAVNSLLNQITTAKMTSVVSETATDLARYGLAKPQIVFRARDMKGGEHSLLVGSKTGDDYYARDSSRPLIFRIPADVYQKLGTTLFDLRDKSLVHINRDQLARIEVHNRYQTVICVQGADNKWTLEEPAAQKGKEVQSWKFLDPLENARAVEILDAPPAAIAARLEKPAVEVTLTDKSDKKTKLSISSATEDFVYARSSAGPTIYKLNKQILDDLSFKLSDLVL